MLSQNKLVFAPDMQFQLSLIFASKARSYTNRASCFPTLMLHKIILLSKKYLPETNLSSLFNPKKGLKYLQPERKEVMKENEARIKVKKRGRKT